MGPGAGQLPVRTGCSDGTRIQTSRPTPELGAVVCSLFGGQRSWLIGYGTWGPAGMLQVQKEWKVTVHASKPEDAQKAAFIPAGCGREGQTDEEWGCLRPQCPLLPQPHTAPPTWF